MSPGNASSSAASSPARSSKPGHTVAYICSVDARCAAGGAYGWMARAILVDLRERMSEGNEGKEATIDASGAEIDARPARSGRPETRLIAAMRQLAAWIEHDDVPSVNARVLWHGTTIARLTTGMASWRDGLP